MLSPPAVVGFKGQEYHNILVATQIPHITGLAPIPYTGRNFLPHQEIEPALHTVVRIQSTKQVTRESEPQIIMRKGYARVSAFSFSML